MEEFNVSLNCKMHYLQICKERLSVQIIFGVIKQDTLKVRNRVKAHKYFLCQSVIMIKIKNNGVTGKSQIFGIMLTDKEISGSKRNE